MPSASTIVSKTSARFFHQRVARLPWSFLERITPLFQILLRRALPWSAVSTWTPLQIQPREKRELRLAARILGLHSLDSSQEVYKRAGLQRIHMKLFLED